MQYKNGFTAKHYSVEALLADAEREVRHSDTLERNMTKAWKDAKPTGAAAHHIVASGEPLAEGSREKLAGWGIGINDADNGVYLPNSPMAEIPNHPNALLHRPIHTEQYYINVYARLRLASDQDSGRLRLRRMKAEMLAGTFPFRKKVS